MRLLIDGECEIQSLFCNYKDDTVTEYGVAVKSSNTQFFTFHYLMLQEYVRASVLFQKIFADCG